MAIRRDPLDRDRWARQRFAIIGPLLAAPPQAGELRATLAALSSKTWQHPATGTAVSFGVSTLERWFYRARRASLDPVAVYLLELDLPEPDLSIYDRDPGDT